MKCKEKESHAKTESHAETVTCKDKESHAKIRVTVQMLPAIALSKWQKHWISNTCNFLHFKRKTSNSRNSIPFFNYNIYGNITSIKAFAWDKRSCESFYHKNKPKRHRFAEYIYPGDTAYEAAIPVLLAIPMALLRVSCERFVVGSIHITKLYSFSRIWNVKHLKLAIKPLLFATPV